MASHTVDNPFTGDVAYSVPHTTESELESVLKKARSAAKALKAMSVDDRVKLVLRACEQMEKRTDEIALEITRQMGKPLSQAKGEVGGMAGRLRHMAGIAKESLADVVLPKENFDRRIVKEPLGVVLDLPAWNYPLLTAVNAIAPAVLAGNSVIVKHAPRTPLCAEHFARAFREAGAPEGIVQAIFLDYEHTEKLVADPRIDQVLFTGSVHGGHRMQLAAKDRFLHIGLELGGNDPAYVAEDCDFDKTVENVVDGAMYNAGQSCCAVERVYVHKSLYDRFVSAVEPLVRAYVLGDPENDKTNMGPVAQPWHPKELEAFVQDAASRGAKIVYGGKPTQVNGRGRFFEPTLLKDVPADAKVMNAESFGPLLPITRVDSDERALQLMNASQLGLTASIWTKDHGRAQKL
ncbi:MAG: aldehyde dehydrogenase family protein, partial [Myxococcaceae bacterium]